MTSMANTSGFFSTLGGNVINPAWSGTQGLGGTAHSVAMEVVVGRLARWALGFKGGQSWIQDVLMYSAAEAFYGGLQGNYVADPKDPNDATLTEAAMDAAKMIPSVFLAQYIVQTGTNNGLHIPRPSIKDALFLAATKIITRPLTCLTTMAGVKTINDAISQHDVIQVQQKNASRLQSTS